MSKNKIKRDTRPLHQRQFEAAKEIKHTVSIVRGNPPWPGAVERNRSLRGKARVKARRAARRTSVFIDLGVGLHG